jgi:hypothetical protein
MSDPKGILERWARLKSASRAQHRDEGGRGRDVATASSPKTEPAFDPATLPPVETINAATELRAFLGEGVPAELTLAALRRGWSVDPAIRDFVGLSENAWDFNDPTAMSGFGTLKTEEIRKLATQILEQVEAREPATASQTDTRKPVEADATLGALADNGAAVQGMLPADPRTAAQERGDASEPSHTTVTESPNAGSAAGQHPDDRPPLRSRRHGGAVPRTG